MSRLQKQLRSAAVEPVRLRVAGPVGLRADQVDVTGGKFGAGLIREYSVITRGDALGHDLWIDKDFLDEVVEAGNARAEGIKGRFAHPALSGDGLGTVIGRSMNFKKRYSQVFADLHFLESSHETPDGDLGGYTLKLAREAPDLFGASIVFSLDEARMKTFGVENRDEKGNFLSPDSHNKANHPHARLQSLAASDVVDDPAANPAGMFSALAGSELAAAADAFLSYAFGLSEDIPEALAGVHPSRARTFAVTFLERHGLALFPVEHEPSFDEISTRLSAVERALKNHDAQFLIIGGRQ